MKASYPNLELMEYMANTMLVNNEDLAKRFDNAKREHGRISGADFVAEVFIQMWGSTCTAFDICADGSPAIAGCAMTEAYTVVMHERLSDTYFIFVDNKPCYYVVDATKKFLDDLRAHNIKSLSEVEKYY